MKYSTYICSTILFKINMANITTYSIKGTPNGKNVEDGSESYLILKGRQFTDKEIAETECNACNKYWGHRILYEVIEN